MAKHLSEIEVNKIVRCIREMGADAISWEAICDAAQRLIGRRPTRQTLCKHSAIHSAYKSCKRVYQEPLTVLAKPASLSIAAQRISRLENELVRVKEEHRQLYELYITMQYNAYKYGLKDWQLLASLPVIDRERTDAR